jgi:hypothetical protein
MIKSYVKCIENAYSIVQIPNDMFFLDYPIIPNKWST